MLTGYQPAQAAAPLFFRGWPVALLSLLLSCGGVWLLLTRL
jgi:hypothetical protein